MTYVCVDEPQGFRSSVPPIVAATNPALGMVRLHGRNRAAWAAPGQHGAEQSKYRYSPAELNEWLPKVRGAGRGDCPDPRALQQLLRR